MDSKTPRIIAIIIIILVLAGIGFWIWQSQKDNKTTATPILSVAAFNQTQNKDASQTPAKASDLIVYTLTAENQSNKVIPGYIMEANISGLSDKSVLTNGNGASYNSATNSLVWTALDIPANGSIQKQFTIQVNSLPSTTQDATLRMKFNNEINIPVTTSTASVSGSQTPPPYKAPVTGPAGNLSAWLALLATGSIFVARKYRLLGIK